MRIAELNGVKVTVFRSKQELMEMALEEKRMLVAVNAEKILNADETVKRIINDNIGYADGVGAVWAAKRKGHKDIVKIPGCELWLDIVTRYYKEKTFYLVGSKQGTITKTVSKLKNNFPEIKILNYRNGYIQTETEKKELFEDVINKKPDIIFVAMGSPKQEMMMEEMQSFHKAVYLGLGGSFDVFVGDVKRAPDWFINNSFEWAYRLIQQPARIKRQLSLIKYLWLLFTGKI